VFGFNSITDLVLHEAVHRKHICHFPDCHYPVFSSARALKGHMKEVHTQISRAVPRKSISKQVQPTGFSPAPPQDIPPLITKLSDSIPPGQIGRLPAPPPIDGEPPLPSVSFIEQPNNAQQK
jgi:hypothetical protein